MQARLNRLARRGLELADTRGFLAGEFRPTRRTDLHYLVLPYGNAENYPGGMDFSPYGYTLLGGFNGMAIFCALPCGTPDSDALRAKLQSEDCIHPDRITVPGITLFLLACLGAMWFSPFGTLLQVPLWTSYQAMGCHVLFGMLALLTGANVLAVAKTPLSHWIHGLTLLIFPCAVILSVLIAMLGAVTAPLLFVSVPVLLAVALWSGLWRKSRPLALILPGICLVFLLFGLLFPYRAQLQAAEQNSRSNISDSRMYTLSMEGETDAPTQTGYFAGGTVLASYCAYYELNAHAALLTVVYRCPTAQMAQAVSDWIEGSQIDWLSQLNWSTPGRQVQVTVSGTTVTAISRSGTLIP